MFPLQETLRGERIIKACGLKADNMSDYSPFDSVGSMMNQYKATIGAEDLGRALDSYKRK